MAKEPDVSLGKTIETQETQGTLEGGRVFLGMAPQLYAAEGSVEIETWVKWIQRATRRAE